MITNKATKVQVRRSVTSLPQGKECDDCRRFFLYGTTMLKIDHHSPTLRTSFYLCSECSTAHGGDTDRLAEWALQRRTEEIAKLVGGQANP